MSHFFCHGRRAVALLAMAVVPMFGITTSHKAWSGPPFAEDEQAAPRRQRPRMQSLPPANRGGSVPSQRSLVDARSTFRKRYGDPTSRVRTSTAALMLAEALLKEAAGENDAAVKWVIIEEARELAISAGSPRVVGQSVRVATAEFDFDALSVEYRALAEIPLRALDPGRASELATAAGAVATRAEVDRRFDVAVSAQGLAIRAWQRAGDIQAARLASQRRDALESAGRSATSP